MKLWTADDEDVADDDDDDDEDVMMMDVSDEGEDDYATEEDYDVDAEDGNASSCTQALTCDRLSTTKDI